MGPVDDTLRRLADAYEIATEYWDWRGQHVLVAPETVVGVLAGLGVDASTPESAQAAVAELDLRPWRRLLPPCVAIREHRAITIAVHVLDGDPVEVWIEREAGGGPQPLRQFENWTAPREIDGRLIGEASFAIPPDLPLGY